MISVLIYNAADFHLCHLNYLNTISVLFLVSIHVVKICIDLSYSPLRKSLLD